VGFIISRIFAEPFYEIAQRYNPEVFAVSDIQKVEGAKDVHKHELRLRMEAAIGRTPPISDMEMQVTSLSISCPAAHSILAHRGSHMSAELLPFWFPLLCTVAHW
jgi:hypothetical protein